jgi:hypothetical protein
MIVGNFNYHQILFAIDSFYDTEDKIGYLEKIHSELERIVNCFEMPKSLPLKMYASKSINITGACKELRDFIKTQFEMATSNPYDTRYPSEGQLRGLLRVELVNYKKLLSIVEEELHTINLSHNKKVNKNSVETETNNSFIVPQKTTPSYIVDILKTKSGKIVWKNSVGELVELMKIILILDLIDDLDEEDIIQFICENFVNSQNQNFSPIQLEKVYKMLANTFWLNSNNSRPKFFR